METLRDECPCNDRQAVKALKVIIVGAGIAGLTAGIALARTGHCVTIFESVSEITDVGAGIQIAPNASRILHRLGVLQHVMDRATVLERVSVRRYTSDEEMTTFPLMPANGLKYGAPMGVIHRGDLQNILLNKALELGCHIFTNHKVIAVDPKFSAKVQVHQGTTDAKFWLSADLIIAADGIKSHVRRQMMNSKSYKDEPIPTGDAAYRLLIPRDRVLDDPLALSMLDQNVAMRYMGPGGHIMAYPIRDNSLYNIVLLHPAKSAALSEDVWTSKGSREDMFKFYAGWSPAIQKWLAHADEDILEWTLYVYPDLPTWIQGSVALLGDACHPMLPYVAQGAANAMEDAAVLATALTCTSNIQLALKMYETIRKPRAEKIAASATATANTLHLPDGPEQIARDQGMMDPGAEKPNPDKWSNLEWQDLMWGVDVMDMTIRMWSELAKVLSLEKRYPQIKKAYTYTLSSNISHGWLLAQLHHLWTRNARRTARCKAATRRNELAKLKKVSTVPSGWDIALWRSKPMMQNPNYKDEQQLTNITAQLMRLPALVHTQEIADLKSHLRDAAQGDAFVLQAGDCAEMFEYCQPDAIESKMQLLHQLRSIIAWGVCKPVICIGRIAGQYAKPRSSRAEMINGEAVPSYRGDALNGHGLHERQVDPGRLLQAYYHSSATLNYMRALDSCFANTRHSHLGHMFDPRVKQRLKKKHSAILDCIEDSFQFGRATGCWMPPGERKRRIYTSHEGLVLEYEAALTRRQKRPISSGQEEPQTDPYSDLYYDTSAHFLWIGDRTRQLDHAHVEFFRGIANPIGVKIGPTTSISDLLSLLRTLNPTQEPGKITLITRYGASKVASLLPAHIRAVEDSEYRRCVVWQCDPMHGNTTSVVGIKSRRFDDVWSELRDTIKIHKQQGSYLGGLHLELTPDPVTECLGGCEGLDEGDLEDNYTSFCDPRLNKVQAYHLSLLFAERLKTELQASCSASSI
ncbi:hypothetical protein MY11210_000513 [Beauveria gryllotalpidicola]